MGFVERRHKHLLDNGLTLLKHAKLPVTYWDYAFLTAAYYYNRNPSSMFNGISLYEAIFQKVPEYNKLRVFGSKCYPCLHAYRSHKLDDKSVTCTFLGYPVNQEAYLCLDPVTRRMYRLRDVRFVEEDLLLSSSLSKDESSSVTGTTTGQFVIDIPILNVPENKNLRQNPPVNSTQNSC